MNSIRQFVRRKTKSPTSRRPHDLELPGCISRSHSRELIPFPIGGRGLRRTVAQTDSEKSARKRRDGEEKRKLAWCFWVAEQSVFSFFVFTMARSFFSASSSNCFKCLGVTWGSPSPFLRIWNQFEWISLATLFKFGMMFNLMPCTISSSPSVSFLHHTLNQFSNLGSVVDKSSLNWLANNDRFEIVCCAHNFRTWFD